MSVRILIGLFLLIGVTTAVGQGRVSRPEAREAIVDRSMALLEIAPRLRGEVPAGRPNPFAPVALERVAPEPEKAPEPVPVAVRLSDDQAIVAVARNFDPAGSLIAGDRRMLRLRDGSMLREGDGFTARISGQAYAVTLSSVDTNGYVLSIGEAQIRRRFLSANREDPGTSAPERAPPSGGP